jgi:hypothetical protein
MSTSSLNMNLTEAEVDTSSVPPYKRADQYVRELIYRTNKRQHNITSFYSEQLRNIITLFNDIVVRMPDMSIRTVKCIPGSPERSIGKLNRDNLIILPVISVEQISTSTEGLPSKYRPLVVAETFWDSNKQRAIRVVSLSPKAVEVTYTISVWSKFKEDQDQITEQIQRMFNPSLESNTPFTDFAQITLSREENMSTTEAGDGDDRILNKAFTINVQTFLPSPKFLMTSTGKIEDIYLEGDIVKP